MKSRVFVLTLAVLLLLPQAYAAAQAPTTAPTMTASTPPQSTTPPPPATPPASGTSAFDQLSPGGQKIALALYQAQVRPHTGSTPGGGTVGSGTGGSTPTRLTLDQIAQRKLDGHGWGQVFKSMKSDGLVRQKNLGQVVSQYNHRHHGHHFRGHDSYASHRGGERHEGYEHRERYGDRGGSEHRGGYENREGQRMYSQHGRGYEGRSYEGHGYQARSYQGGGSSGDSGARLAAGSGRSYTAARSYDSAGGSQAGSSARAGGNNVNGHGK